MAGYVVDEGNVVVIRGDFTLREMPRALAAIHRITNGKGYQDYVLDFADCARAFAGPMLGLVAQAQACWAKGIDVALILPKDPTLARLFTNSNWAHLIDFRGHEASRFTGTSQVPAMRFRSLDEHQASVDRILKVMFGALTDFSRNDLRALEWSLNEVTDNVLNHANSPVGGFVQITNFSVASKRLQFAVADPGIGIPGSLRPSYPDIRSDAEALDSAIREGVTRSEDVGQGNGLFGTWRIAELSGGRLNILSGYAALESSPERGLHIAAQSIPYSGTLVVADIPYARPVDLGDAFEFAGRRHEPVDYVDLHFATDDAGRPIFSLGEEATGFGSREAGRLIKRKIDNLIRLAKDDVVIDFTGVPLVSSSFADEVFGMLFRELGPIQFGARIKMIKLDPLVRSLIDRAIMQRARV